MFGGLSNEFYPIKEIKEGKCVLGGNQNVPLGLKRQRNPSL